MSVGSISESDWQPLCDLLAQKIREKIAEQDHNATGSLSASVEAQAVELADRFCIEVRANHYGKFVNNGREPGTMPPVSVIYEWMKVRNIGVELQRESERRSLAFAIATSIREKGIPPLGGYSQHYAKGNTIERTGFADKVVEENFDTIEEHVLDILGKVADWIVFNQYRKKYQHINKQ